MQPTDRPVSPDLARQLEDALRPAINNPATRRNVVDVLAVVVQSVDANAFEHGREYERLRSERRPGEPILSMSQHHDHVHPPWGVEQVGWLGQTGRVYSLDDAPYDDREPGSFTALYQARDVSCGHQDPDPYADIDNPRDVPGYEGSVGPGPRQYNRAHVYARDVQSGAGNCVCGWAPGDWVHTEIAPGYPIPNDRRHGRPSPRDYDDYPAGVQCRCPKLPGHTCTH